MGEPAAGSRLLRLGGQSLVYGLGYGLTRLLRFALLPIYTRYLAPEEYGVPALLLVTGAIATIPAQVGMGSAMFREIIYLGTDRRDVESTELLFPASLEVAERYAGLRQLTRPHDPS